MAFPVLRLSFRFQLGLALVVVNALLTAGVAILAYRVAHDAMVDQALRSISLVAESRQRELLDMLEHRQERLTGFLQSLELLCGERGPSGGFGFEDECTRAAVGGFHRSERALTTEVSYASRHIDGVGPRPAVLPPVPGRLIRIQSPSDTGRYAMAANVGDLAVHVEFSLDDVNAVLADRAGLESNGEAFLTDSAGYRLTSTRRAVAAPYPVAMAPIAPCLRGIEHAAQTTDDRGVTVISGLRPSGPLGGGCLVANVNYDDATAPIRRLGQVLAYASMLVAVLGGLASILVATLVTRPLWRLTKATHELGAGRLDTPVPIGGPSDVRQLGRTLSAMASSLSRLVAQEQQARREAEAANRTKDEFLATLSHELRTPLNAILGWASILSRSDYDKSRVSHAVHVIERNARIQAQMIEELLDVSRISAGTVTLNASAVAVGPVLEAAVESVRPAADAKGVSLVKRLSDPDLTMHADPRRLQQIAWNLLSNAVRFTPAGGRVEVFLRRDGDEVELRVVDTGCGIPPEFLPHVFERFRQGDSSTTRAHGGLGLGLAIVRDLVELHGGTVRADSAGDGQGSTFTVRIPATLIQRSTAFTPMPPDLTPLVGARVLVVDDDADTRDVLKAVLEAAGAEVVLSHSARETRTLFSRTHPDLIIADIGMPDEDGYSLITWIREMETGTSHVPAIALTARTRPEDVALALASGFQMHLAKPIDSRRLVESIANLVVRT